MENTQPNYYAIIPANVRYDKNLSANAKLLYGEITALCNKEGKCWAKNEYFAELYGVSDRTVKTWIKQLKDLGYIETILIYKENSKEISKRYITIQGGEKKFTTVVKESSLPSGKKIHHRGEENCPDNITSINITRENIKNKLDKSSLQKSEKFDFTLKQVIDYANTSKQYKEELKKAIKAEEGNLTFENFETSLLAKGYKYKNFFLAYKSWNSKEKEKTKTKSDYLARCTKEKEIDYSQPINPRIPF